MKYYTIRVYENGDKYYYNENDQLHREDGPAIKASNGFNAWYLEGRCYPEVEFNKRISVTSLDGKIVEIDGKKYELKEVK